MESNEEYLLRVLRRTSSGLTDSLIPAHGAKLTKLLEKFERAGSVTQSVQKMLNVQGFSKCALAMEWLLEKTKRTDTHFGPEQFESDVLLLNEKLFEAFLNQPFDMPDFSQTFEAPVRPVQQDIQLTDDEFLGTSYTQQDSTLQAGQEKTTIEEKSRSIAEPSWEISPSIETYESALTSASSNSTQSDSSPSLQEAMDADLLEATERVLQTAIDFSDKLPNERAIAIAVLRVTARAASETAKASSNITVQDFYEAFIRLIGYADEQGKIRSDAFADIIRDVGDRLSAAMKQQTGGVTMLKNITKYINDPKEIFKKK